MVFIDNVVRLASPTFAQISVRSPFFEANSKYRKRNRFLYVSFFNVAVSAARLNGIDRSRLAGILARKIVPQISAAGIKGKGKYAVFRQMKLNIPRCCRKGQGFRLCIEAHLYFPAGAICL